LKQTVFPNISKWMELLIHAKLVLFHAAVGNTKPLLAPAPTIAFAPIASPKQALPVRTLVARENRVMMEITLP
jgi:hypothetical protein